MKNRRLRIERLARREEKATIKRIFYLSIFSFVLIIFIFTLGTRILGKLADVLFAVFQNQKDSENQDTETLEGPRLESLPEATNSARLVIVGFSNGIKVKIFLNDSEYGEASVTDGKFKFENLILDSEENKIAAKTIGKGGNESSFSDTEIVVFDNVEPKLEVESPFDGQSFTTNNKIRVSGQTEPDAQVNANAFLATINTEGKFEVVVPVSEGENSIEVKAIDEAGNTKTVTIKINFKK